MLKHILIAYGSGTGSTAEVAEAIATVLRAQPEGNSAAGSEVLVDVKNVLDIDDIDSYSAVVVGSSIRAGRWLPEAIDFVENMRQALKKRPVAYFTTCLTMVNNTPNSQRIVIGYMEPLLKLDPNIQPVALGLFAGSLDPGRQPIIPGEGGPYGDFRNWDAIREWAEKIRPLLLESQAEDFGKVEDMRGVTLSFTDLSRSDLSEVDLQGAQMQEADLSQAELHDSTLSWADLSGSRMVAANLAQASLIGSVLNRADCQEANLEGAILNGAKMVEINLYQANLRHADLNWANLTDANLAGADLHGAHLGWACLEGANLAEANLDGAFYNEHTIWPADFSPREAGCIEQYQLSM
ncbi:MAG: pentapeptide repeat-containing protein [Ardenticatenaceae bacterium]|nr:pentapeptide repeat-containing protein [Ardenticatenaceae bacterium]